MGLISISLFASSIAVAEYLIMATDLLSPLKYIEDGYSFAMYILNGNVYWPGIAVFKGNLNSGDLYFIKNSSCLCSAVLAKIPF